jgi:signal transduction histidine kinase
VLRPNAEQFEVLHNEAMHLQRVVDDLRTLSLADAGELTLNVQPLKPATLLQRTAAAYRQRAEQQGVALVTQVASGLPRVTVDPERMAQVLGNLVSNALRYTPHGGRITLSACLGQGSVLLEVSDTGVGIAPEALPRIFDRFYRGDEAREGSEGESGLGLAIARSIVELHGGAITAASALGKGTKLVTTLPVAE